MSDYTKQHSKRMDVKRLLERVNLSDRFLLCWFKLSVNFPSKKYHLYFEKINILYSVLYTGLFQSLKHACHMVTVIFGGL